MNRIKSRSTWWIASLIAAALAVGVASWILLGDKLVLDSRKVSASEQVIANFYTSLAALDVEENERALQLLQETVAMETREPALWANLAVAQVRLNEPEKATESLTRGLSLAGQSRELAMLNAQLLTYSGQIEAAIEQLRQLHEVWPENVIATFSLVSLLGQIRDDSAEAERLTLLASALNHRPGNLRVLIEQARVAAALEQSEVVRSTIEQLASGSGTWPEPIEQQLSQARDFAKEGDFRQAVLSLTFFENLLKPRAEYRQSLSELGISSLGAIGTPLRSPLRLQIPDVQSASADTQLTFTQTNPFGKAARPDLVLVMEHSGGRRSTLLSLSAGELHVNASAALPFPGLSIPTDLASVCLADLNFDFKQDLILVGNGGCHIYLAGDDDAFTRLAATVRDLDRPWRGVWTSDVDADGDLDLLLSDHESELRCLRNNGDLTFDWVDDMYTVTAVVALCRIDFDSDGDVDLISLNQSGLLAAWSNERNGRFVATEFSDPLPRLAVAVGDVDRDGTMEVVTTDGSGVVRAAQWRGNRWSESVLANWPESISWSDTVAGSVFLSMDDIDNNGNVDIVASVAGDTIVWLQTADGSWTLLPQTPAMQTTGVMDYDGDGLLDLVGLSDDGTSVALNRSQAGYGWHVVEPMANPDAGDKRINSFGIGGRIEIRAGYFAQAATIDSPRVHFGLGHHRASNVARIIWPNGTIQAEFDLPSGASLVAKQRLKGSCPWVFAFDGKEFRFIKDFIWRSPLGLRINAQATAGVTQTEDWIKIPGEAIAAVEDRYRLRITAELWETHFFDQLSMLAVDHPVDVDVFVDERFVPQAAPAQQIAVLTPPRPLLNLQDDLGRSLVDKLRDNDGDYADGFGLGEFQGVASDHWVEFTIPDDVSPDQHAVIVGHGWIYPTDSSLNAALDQGSSPRPYGLILEQQTAAGDWMLVRDDLGFPAGKNKDVLIALPGDALALSRRFRLRTNMEVYWDSLRLSLDASHVEPQITVLNSAVCSLRPRGFSRLLPVNRRRPDTPVYEVVSRQQRWLDLEGFYTRFGDVSVLLGEVDDRYVIVNAGDELVLEFEALGEPQPGWHRDFVLVGDGWVKDGDFNTAFSQTVRPLPTHADSDYQGPHVPLEQDPVYQRHADDWQQYHTRYLTTDNLFQQLWQPAEWGAEREKRR